ncbi:M14 family metallopeptidase [Halalkalibacterium halodurans]|uniref:M14 family metallopeptidase n=1 Tax=Halalkalibacterium halodurans TaxID=86665 RepID=UPI002AA9AD52|nr:M14 family zinc carboxypeptidase [Halalkalibacterium halodurans]MDY7224368.1 M14 family zinc carboxypeptidase [Halalkalibacterium halodurans]MDY7243653.1 M14 family zinc carboxypeptidase [Halalkalibacterium halodurans]
MRTHRWTLWLLLILFFIALPQVTYVTEAKQQTEVADQEQELQVDRTLLSLTEEREVKVSFSIPDHLELDDFVWVFGGKALEDWKSWDGESRDFSGDSFITFTKEPTIDRKTNDVHATLHFSLPFGTDDLSPRTIRVRYPELMGEYDLAVTHPSSGFSLSQSMSLKVYDEFLTYEEIKPAIDEVLQDAPEDRYLEYQSLGKSVEGRDLHFVVLAKDEEAVHRYLNETLPTALEQPERLLETLEDGTLEDYQVPIWFNNIHPDEVEGIDAQMEVFRTLALEDQVTFHTEDEDGHRKEVTFDVEDALNHVIFLFHFTHNPDGRVANTRENANGFDLNRDNAYQTQPETIQVNEHIGKWTPLSFIDLHGYVEGFLIEPATPPHNPNFEYDLLVDSMIGQAHAMGRAGIGSSTLDSYFIPLLDWENGWDDMSPAYTAMFAMLHGAIAHTVEVPTLSQNSYRAMVGLSYGAIDYVLTNKDALFQHQLELFARGVRGEDHRSVDEWFVNQEGDVIGRQRGAHDSFFPDYYVLPIGAAQKNELEAKRMVEYFLRNGIQVEQTTSPVAVNGVTYEQGTYVIPMAQAKRGFVNAMLYSGADLSDWTAMYDSVVVNFPALRGFDVVEVRQKDAFKGEAEPVQEVEWTSLAVHGKNSYYVVANSNNEAIQLVNQLLKAGKPVYVAAKSHRTVQEGDFIVRSRDLQAPLKNTHVDATPLHNKSSVHVKRLSQPKVAVVGSAQTRYVIEQLGFPIVSTDEADVIVDDLGNFNRKEASGKMYVGIGGRSLQAIEEANVLKGFATGSTALNHEGLLEAVMENSRYTAGYEKEEALYVTTGSWIAELPDKATILATVADRDDFLISGWWPEHEKARGQVIAASIEMNETDYVLFANDLTFRAHPQHSYRLLANSLFAAKESCTAPLLRMRPFEVTQSDTKGEKQLGGCSTKPKKLKPLVPVSD